MLSLTLYAGDVAPVPALVLCDQAGNPVNLNPVASLTFRMADARDGHVAVSAAATKTQDDGEPSTFGQVFYAWAPADTARPGLYRAWFIFDGGSGPCRFPVGEDFYVLIKPAP